MKKFIIAILAILAAIFAVLYFSKERVNLSQGGDNGEIIGQEKSNLKENLEYYGKKIIKKADEKFDEAKQTLKHEQKYHEQLKSEANRDVKIFEPIYKNEKKLPNSKKNQNLQNSVQIGGENVQNSPNSGQQKSQNPNPQNKKKIEIELN
ncbi:MULTISPECIES: hypothetical protein [unclassified Campylobacter]|uniref:hypothetical protein n=1 Tax=unclassified Campylobacter TaxID=2593542 RepID=UPI0022E9D53E|nr:MULTISPECIES: hypothetical protein [unclassified Campylobacter]MDA3055561.1 hypothetical protein [Campylobacter sp. CN_NA1]MDA3064749.1 hypothetical protein [Campylobacter sp. CN_NE4]MDA3068427.1 hypothetical protein [Campylobacter sp. CN_NE3]MDA3082260.1 hypothetical protein [Campylobacter sp. CN_EL2]MDA3083895.1 hypothetical protein [Campylobacter sp. CN_NE1]